MGRETKLPILQIIFLTLAVSLMAGFIGGQVGQQRAIAKYPGPPSGAIVWVLERSINEQLDLTDDQEEALATIVQRHRTTREQIRRDTGSAARDFALAVDARISGNGDAEALDASIRLADEGAERRLRDAIVYLDEVNALLDDDQRAILRANLSNMLLRAAENR